MKQRVDDKVPDVRAYAVRALSRFANDAGNSDIIDLLLRALSQEPSIVCFGTHFTIFFVAILTLY